MAQRFSTNDEDETKFFAVWEALLQGTFDDLDAYFENVYKSPELGNALSDSQAVDVWSILEKSFFVKIYPALIEGGYTAGAIDTYCRIIYELFGDETDIVIATSNPLEISIDVTAEYSNLSQWISQLGDTMLTRDGDNIVFRTLLTDIPRSQLYSLIKAITNAGTKVNFNLN